MRNMMGLAALAASVAIASICGPARAQEVVGDWHGTLKTPEVTLRLGVTIVPKAGGGYDGVFALPDQGASLPLGDVKAEGGALSFSVPAAKTTFSGKWDADHKAWAGNWTGTSTVPLVLTSGKPEARAAGTPAADIPPMALYATPHLVKLPDGRSLNLVCMGEGMPSVILEDALGSSAWQLVQYKIARTTRTCYPSRAGHGFSDDGRLPRDATAIAADLDALLRASREKGPYVLVGHSMSSYFVRVYADLHPKDVVGMVLVDPSFDDMLKRMMEIEPRLAKGDADLAPLAKCAAAAEAGELKPGTDAYKTCTPAPAEGWSKFYRTEKAEADSMVRDSDEAKAHRRSYGDMPLVVLTAGKASPSSDMTEAQNQAWQKVWMKAHDDLAALSSRGQNRVVDGAGHNIQIEKPQVVIDTVNEVVAEARKRITTH